MIYGSFSLYLHEYIVIRLPCMCVGIPFEAETLNCLLMKKKPIKETVPSASKKVGRKEKVRNRIRYVILPVHLLFLLAVWLWASVYMGPLFRVSKEYSFWVSDFWQMDFVLSRPYGFLWYVGRLLLQLFHFTWLGGLLLAFLLSAGSWLTGYCFRLVPRWRFLQYVPSLVYVALVSYHGLDVFFETETGMLMGIPLLYVLVLSVSAVIIRSFSRKPVPVYIGIPKDESSRDNVWQLMVMAAGFAGVVFYTHQYRPYVRPLCKMMIYQQAQDWTALQDEARAHAELSYRPMAAYYAIALAQTDQIGSRLYDIRLDFDMMHLAGMDDQGNTGLSLYLPEGNYYAGLFLPAYHQCMEQMVMTGPTIRLLKLMTKCALARSEWVLARKYLRLLSDVPFEQKFCEKYGAMVMRPDLVNADAEISLLRRTEPVRDSFESQYQTPLFLGYNFALSEARSIVAFQHSLAVCQYSKMFPDFIQRLNFFQGTMPEDNVADGILIADRHYPGVADAFNGLQFRKARLDAFFSETRPYMHDRARYAKELFSKYRGYYPYYYLFGNLKATKPVPQKSSASGVN